MRGLAAKIRESIEEEFDSYSFKKHGSPRKIESALISLLKDAEELKRQKIRNDALILLERKRWVEEGFAKEGFKIAVEVLYGDIIEEYGPYPFLKGIRFYAVRNDILIQAEVNVYESYATVWTEIKVPWYFVEACPRGKASLLRAVSDKYKDVVADLLCDLADKHKVCINMIWYLTDVCAYPRKNIAGAVRRLCRFLKNYSYEELSRKAIEILEQMAIRKKKERSRKKTPPQYEKNLTQFLNFPEN